MGSLLMQVGWDESTAGERQPRVSLWEIEPLTTFPMYPSPFPLRLKRPWPSGIPSFHGIFGFMLEEHMVSYVSKNVFFSPSNTQWYVHFRAQRW